MRTRDGRSCPSTMRFRDPQEVGCRCLQVCRRPAPSSRRPRGRYRGGDRPRRGTEGGIQQADRRHREHEGAWGEEIAGERSGKFVRVQKMIRMKVAAGTSGTSRTNRRRRTTWYNAATVPTNIVLATKKPIQGWPRSRCRPVPMKGSCACRRPSPRRCSATPGFRSPKKVSMSACLTLVSIAENRSPIVASTANS